MARTGTAEDDDEILNSIEDMANPGFRWTLRKQKFVYHMARTGNSVEAEKLAGYADGHGRVLLSQQPVRDRLQRELRSVLHSEEENEESVIARWHRWANSDIGDYFDQNWQLVDVTQLTEDQRKCVKKVKVTVNQFGRNIDLELYDASQANVHLANVLGLLSKDEDGATPPEDTVRSIQQMLKEMREVNALDEDSEESQMEGTTRGKTPTTH